MSDLPDWAAEEIERVLVSGSRTLNLRIRKQLPLHTFPMEILQCQNLQELILVGNRIDFLPPEIHELKDLELLDVGINPLAELPSEIGNLTRLTTLVLWGCELRVLPSEIADLARLQTLSITANPLIELPAWIARLGELRDLKIGSAGKPYLTELPHWIRTLHKLEKLRLRGHALRDLPRWLVHLPKLQVLDVGNNDLTCIPDVVFNMAQLRELDLSNVDSVARNDANGYFVTNNRIREIPPDVLRLRNLAHLNLHRNPVETPPLEILESDMNRGISLDALRRYFVQLQREGTDHLHEAKLLIVGEPGAGKSTLARKLIDPDYDLSDEDSTRGIDIRLWNFEGLGKQFRVNLWDFGGQEIYHATHQFFLTRRSLYVLVADSRKEDTDFSYWLNVVELLSDASPSIVLLNEKNDRYRDLNIPELRRQFPSLRHVVRTNLATDRGYEDLVRCIKNELASLPHIGTPLPKTWVNVRLALETDDRPWVSSDEFEQICGSHGFTSVHEKLQLGAFLHDLGVILYFQKDPVLRRVVIIRPEWGTRAVYQILDDRAVIEAGGRFDDEDLARVWSDPLYSNMRVELLRLMLNFGLCYEAPGVRGSYVSPQLLPASAPEYEWHEEQNLRVRFIYEFLPKGIIPQLTVQLHRLIERQSLAWKSGVVLSYNHSRAEVIEYYGQRQIEIRVAGPSKRELLGIISHALGVIHSTYLGLRVQELIPCACATCGTATDPEYYPLVVLRQFIQDRQEFIQCRISYANIKVRELLSEVSDVTPELSGVARTATGSLVEIPDTPTAPEAIGESVMEEHRQVPSKPDVSAPEWTLEHDQPRPPVNAWANGSFYLVAVVVVLGAVAMVTKIAPLVAVPIALVVGVLLVSIIGAFQLRSDAGLSDKSFVDLMRITLARMPSLRRIEKGSDVSARSEEGPE
jgi:internalin A